MTSKTRANCQDISSRHQCSCSISCTVRDLAMLSVLLAMLSVLLAVATRMCPLRSLDECILDEGWRRLGMYRTTSAHCVHLQLTPAPLHIVPFTYLLLQVLRRRRCYPLDVLRSGHLGNYSECRNESDCIKSSKKSVRLSEVTAGWIPRNSCISYLVFGHGRVGSASIPIQ